MSTYLVTGGAGFIGSHLVDALVSLNHKVIVIDNLSTGKKENINKKVEFIEADVNDVSVLEDLFKRIDFCYHLAATTSVQKSINNWLEAHNNNLTATVNIFNQAANNNVPVIYASSAAVYGGVEQIPITEEAEISPISPYGIDKYCCELQAKVFASIKKLPTIGMRFFNVYGPRQDPNSPYSGVISIFTDRVNNNKSINIYGDGDQERDFIYVADVVEALVIAGAKIKNIGAKAKIYNICTGEGTSINELAKIIFDLSSKKVDINYLPAKEGDIYKSIGDFNKINNDLAFKSKVSISKGLLNLIF